MQNRVTDGQVCPWASCSTDTPPIQCV